MGQIKLYANGGSRNHGCEAILRSTKKILDKNMCVYSIAQNEDLENKINEIMEIKENRNEDLKKGSLKYYISAINIKLFKSTLKNTEYIKKTFLDDVKKGDLYLSVGGDNYCYTGLEELGNLNTLINKRGAKTVLWGCSVEPNVIKDEKVKKDLNTYSLIVARETLTYNALKENGINKSILCPDPAFQLDKIDLPLPKGFEENNTVGINVSPLIIDCESKKGSTMENYEGLIKHIIDTTDMQIALIPHVVWDNNDDRKPLKVLYDKFKDTGRVVMLEDHNCMELKGYISRCRFFIGARTHATIAAYSTCVPTLVIGYSVKAKGIAKDIFGTYENYVLPVQSLSNKDDLINAFERMKTNEDVIRKHLNEFMPGYKSKALKGKVEIEKLLEG